MCILTLGKLSIIIVSLAAVVVLAVFAPRFLFRQARISHELSRAIAYGESLEIALSDTRIIDYWGRWENIYVKLELPPETYEQAKQRFLLFSSTASDKDYTEEIQSGASQYEYSEREFDFLLRMVVNSKKRNERHSMNLDEYQELMIMEHLYGTIWRGMMTTGATVYLLVKENSGAHYLYIYS